MKSERVVNEGEERWFVDWIESDDDAFWACWEEWKLWIWPAYDPYVSRRLVGYVKAERVARKTV